MGEWSLPPRFLPVSPDRGSGFWEENHLGRNIAINYTSIYSSGIWKLNKDPSFPSFTGIPDRLKPGGCLVLCVPFLAEKEQETN